MDNPNHVPNIGQPIPSVPPWLAESSASASAAALPLPPPNLNVRPSFATTNSNTPIPRPQSAPHPNTTQSSQRDATIAELRNRKLLLQKAIEQIDASVVQLMAARSGIPSAIWLPKMQEVYTDVKSRKDLLSKVNHAIAQASGQVLPTPDTAAGPGSAVADERVQPNAAATAQTETSEPVGNNQLSPSSQLRRASSQPELGPIPQQPRVMYTLADLVQRRTVLQESIISWTNGATQLQTTRTSTPSPTWLAQYEQTQFEIKRRQELMVKLNNAITQMSAQAHPETRVQVPPPLDKPRFDAAYGNYCRGKGIEINTKIIMPDIRIPVLELYQLHVAVMREGSFAKVNAADSWHIVGGKLGFAQNAPVVPTEPLRSTPEIATHLQRVYKDRLEHFDYLYISSVIGAVRKRAAEQNKQNTQIPALAPV